MTSRPWRTASAAPGMPSTSTSPSGSTPEDLHVDVPPYTDVHLRTRLGDYETTSLALVITKGSRTEQAGPGARASRSRPEA